jgi:hypothetical protein
MGLKLKARALGGSVEINPVNTASNLNVDVRAANGVLLVADSTTGGMFLPVGTTAQRPTPATGQMRFNTTTGSVEVYNGTSWG